MENVTLHWIGDSTVQMNDIRTYPQCGMGQVLNLYLRPEVKIKNYAKNGRSSKSFWDEGLFRFVEENLTSNDILLIQFGHNDEKRQDPSRYTTLPEFEANLLRYAKIAQQCGARPVLVTPLVRRRFENGILCPTHEGYPKTIRDLAQKEKIPLIDLTASSASRLTELGEENSRTLYMNFEAGRYSSAMAGKSDDTHLRYEGAVQFAGLIAKGFFELGSPYKELLLPDLVDI